MELLTKQFADYIQFEKRFSPHTIKAYTNDVNQFLNYIETHYQLNKLIEITHLHIRSWVVSLMDNGISARAVNRKVTTLKTFYNYFLRKELITINPMLKIQAPKAGKKITVFIEKDNLDKLLDNTAFENDFSGTRNKLIIELFYATGMRLSELIGIKKSDIDYYNKNIKVLGKRNKERLIPVTSNMIDLIKKYNDIKEENKLTKSHYFFVTSTDKKLYEKLVYRIVNNYLSKVTTISKKSPHVLRHSFATHMLNNGADINAIKELLGHSSLAATQVYTHNSVEKLKSVHKQAHPRG